MLSVRDLRKAFLTASGEQVALAGIDFEVAKGQFFTLLGPSGCGKTTTLRSLAGLEQPSSGEITIGRTLVFSSSRRLCVPANRRAIGMVFQSYAIWPHMTVFGNVAYPLRIKKVPRTEIRRRVGDVLELVGLGHLADRPAPHLSGGQQQRVALARALIGEPELLLLDEPLSNLDAKLRVQMRVELKKMQTRLGVTTVYVTHDQHEAMSMSDCVAVMNHGHIEQCSDPDSIYHNPANAFIAAFVGSTNLIQGTLCEVALRAGANRVDSAIGPLVAQSPPGVQLSSRRVVISIRPELASLADCRSADPNANAIPGRIAHIVFLGDSIEYEVRVGETLLRVKAPAIPRRALDSEVFVRVPVEHCMLLGDSRESADAGSASAGGQSL